MKELIGEDLFDQVATADAICITTNCTILDDGSNPMGGGCAGAARRLWGPSIEFIYGGLLNILPCVPCILGFADRDNSEDFIIPDDMTSRDGWCAIVAYPTMYSIGEPADLKLVERSAELLVELANLNNWESIVVPRPGAGIGGLDWETEVKPALESILDDRFILIHKEFSPPKKWITAT